MGDKYQQLVLAYKKLRKEKSLLKKAVLQNREKIETLELENREITKKCRSVTEKASMLQFENKGLTKRVEVLQKQNNSPKNEGGGGWLWSGSKTELNKVKSELGVLSAELQNKIQENAKLHLQMDALKKQHANVISLLENRLDRLKTETQRQAERIHDTKNEHEQELNQILAEKAAVDQKVKELETNLTRTKAMYDQKVETSAAIETLMTKQLKKANTILSRKFLFDDTQEDRWNRLNIPSYDREREEKKLALFKQWQDHFGSFVTSFEQYYTAFHERLLVMNKSSSITDDLRHINRKLGLMLPEHSKSLRKIHDGFKDLIQDYASSGRRELNPKLCEMIIGFFERHLRSTDKLLSYHKLRLEEESFQSDCDAETKDLNNQLYQCHHRLKLSLDKLWPYFIMALRPAEVAATLSLSTTAATEPQFSSYNRLFIIQHSFDNLALMTNVLRDFSAKQLAKISRKQQDPLALPALKSAQKNMLGAFANIVIFASKMQQSFDQVLTLSVAPSAIPVRGAKVRRSHPGLHLMQDRARSYLSQLNSVVEHHQSVPYNKALEHVTIVEEFDKRQNIMRMSLQKVEDEKQQLEQEKHQLKDSLASAKDSLASKQSHLNSLLGELASTRQRLVKVSALLNTSEGSPASPLIAFEEPAKTTPTLLAPTNFTFPAVPAGNGVNTEENTATGSQAGDGGDDAVATKSIAPANLLDLPLEEMRTPLVREGSDQKGYSMVVMDESGHQSASLGLSEADVQREMEMKEYYEAKVTQLTLQVKVADTKAVDCHKQYQVAVKRLEVNLQKQQLLNDEISQLTKQLQEGKEELAETRKAYDKQMKVFSEHMLSLNEKLVSQEDQLTLFKEQDRSKARTRK